MNKLELVHITEQKQEYELRLALVGFTYSCKASDFLP